MPRVNHGPEDESNLQRYYSKSQSLIKQLRQMIEQREAAIDALDLPVATLSSGFTDDNEVVNFPMLSKMETDLNDHLQLPQDRVLQKEKIFKKHGTLFSEMQDYLYKKKGSGKRLQ